MRAAAVFAGVWAAILLTGCGGEPQPGALVGDAFLAQNIDQQVNLRRMPVHLLRTVEELDSVLAPLCPPRGPNDTPPLRAAWERGWRERQRILVPLRLRSAVTDTAAQFRMDSVPPGDYLLWADTVLSEKRWTWLVPVTLDDGDTVRVNLTNDNPDENPLRCKGRED